MRTIEISAKRFSTWIWLITALWSCGFYFGQLWLGIDTSSSALDFLNAIGSRSICDYQFLTTYQTTLDAGAYISTLASLVALPIPLLLILTFLRFSGLVKFVLTDTIEHSIGYLWIGALLAIIYMLYFRPYNIHAFQQAGIETCAWFRVAAIAYREKPPANAIAIAYLILFGGFWMTAWSTVPTSIRTKSQISEEN